MEKTLEELIAGEFTQTLARVEVRQCGTGNPIVYSGPGIVRQDDNRELVLQVLDSAHIDETEKFKRLIDDGTSFGKLVPDSGYYDITAMDNAGEAWRASRQSINCRFGQGISEIVVVLRRWEREEERRATCAGNKRIWWVPRNVNFPWNEKSMLGKVAGFHKFVGEAPGCSWRISKIAQGVSIEFQVYEGDLEQRATRFWRGLGILAGQSLEPRITETLGDTVYVLTLHHPMKVYGRLRNLAPLRQHVVQDGPDSVRFLQQFLALEARPNGRDDPGRVIYAFWHRILRSLHEDIENASLVLSVAIEGLIKNVFAPDASSDQAFVETLHHGIALLKKHGASERAIGVLEGKVEQSSHFPPIRFLHEARKAGWLTTEHVSAWEVMRQKGAHGELVSDDAQDIQKHLDRFHLGLDTFYRLVFQATGYEGRHLAYGLPDAPLLNFPPRSTTSS